MSELVRVYIDDVEYRLPKGANLVDAAKMIGNDIPVFCYHPKLAPVGMCRMCLVEQGSVALDQNKQWTMDESGKPVFRWLPKLQTACTQFVTDGMAIRTTTAQVNEARDDILEFLLTSHPLDCPVCDKGGECPLQNLTMRHGPGQSRFIFDEKQHLAKHYPLGDLIFLDRERCIQCARCTRFQEELVGDDVLAFHERGRRLQIVTTSHPPFDTYFSGNTTDICPVGALTTADFRFSARPWELTEVPSICPHCPVGCNLSLTTRPDRDYNGMSIVKRVMPRQNEDVNEIWICDKGRFGHHHARSLDRIRKPLVRKNGRLVESTWDEAYEVIANKLKENYTIGAISGPMLSNEDLWELRKLVEKAGGKAEMLGAYPYRMTGAQYTAKVGLPVGSNFTNWGKGSMVVVIASDLVEEAPIYYLRIKTARDRGAKVVVLNARPTELDRWGKSVRYSYGNEIEALNALDIPADLKNLAILVGGEGLDRAGHGQLMQAAAARLVQTGYAGKVDSGLLAVWAGANTQGAFDLGYSAEATEHMIAERPGVLFLADADVMREDAQAAALLNGGFTVVTDLFLTATAEQADVVLPRQAFAERDGSFTNGERRVQRFYTAQSPLDGTRPDWKIFAEIGNKLGYGKPKLSPASVMVEITKSVPLYAGMAYSNISKVAPQVPDIGGADQYYGGTAYDNKGGTGVQWEVEAASGAVSIEAPAARSARPASQNGELLIVPITELYDTQVEFGKSRELMETHIPAPYVILNTEDATGRGIKEGDSVAMQFGTGSVEVTVRTQGTCPQGVALLPRYLSAQPTPTIPVTGSVRKIEVMAQHG